METDNPKNLQAFNWFEKDGHVERRCNHFRLIDLTRDRDRDRNRDRDSFLKRALKESKNFKLGSLKTP